jgi:sigma-B regulation protein RsbU (phosphoserine phosphatase)
MQHYEIIDRLSFQIHSLQEGFDILGRSRSMQELGRQFLHILRGSLMISDVNIYYRPANENEWQAVQINNKASREYTGYFKTNGEFNVTYLDEGKFRAIMSLPMIDHSYFGLIVGEKFDKSDYTDIDRITLQIFIQLLDSGYQFFKNRVKEKDLVFSLNQRVLQLNSLIDTGIEISKLKQDSSLQHLALERVVALTNASKGMLKITHGRNVKDKYFFPAPFKYRSLEKEGCCISTEFRFREELYIFKLFEKESRNGAIPFDPTDQLLLDAFARQTHVALENNFLHIEALEKQKIDQDISVAATIQQRILPDKLPGIPGYEIAGINIPTRFVGGDYYDCIPLGENRFALVIADVSGKGVSASLLVSSLHASLTAYLESRIPLDELAGRLNKVIFNASTEDKYITFYTGILNGTDHTLQSLNAGHNPPYLYHRDGKIEELRSGGIPFGMMGLDFPYQSEILTINSGESLLLYTDGVTEAMNENEEEYDDMRPLKSFLKKHINEDAGQFIDQLIQDIKDFTADTPQSDDITALYLRRIR